MNLQSFSIHANSRLNAQAFQRGELDWVVLFVTHEGEEGYLFLFHGNMKGWQYTEDCLCAMQNLMDLGETVWVASCYPDRCLNSGRLPKGATRLFKAHMSVLLATFGGVFEYVDIRPGKVDGYTKFLHGITFTMLAAVAAFNVFCSPAHNNNIDIDIYINIDIEEQHK